MNSQVLVPHKERQIAILSYNHRNLKEPALNGLNLYANHN